MHFWCETPLFAACRAACRSDVVFVSRKLASMEYGRPLTPNWQGTLGLRWGVAASCQAAWHALPPGF